jgi:hypothetical protein
MENALIGRLYSIVYSTCLGCYLHDFLGLGCGSADIMRLCGEPLDFTCTTVYERVDKLSTRRISTHRKLDEERRRGQTLLPQSGTSL